MKKYLLIFILILAFGLRFIKLDTYPAFNADEAALGYNAYSLLLTGKDEHGNKWPIHFQSFNDYKPGGYVYMIMPFVKLFGLNEWSVRVPNALLAVLSVYVLYLLTEILFKDKRISLLSALFLAISPWHIHFSRGGWEVNTATFFILLAVYGFLKYISVKKSKYIVISLLSFAVSIYTYHAARLISPLLGLGLLLIYWKEINLFENLKKYILFGFTFLVLLSPLIIDFTSGAVGSRVVGVGLFADPGPLSRIEELRSQHTDFRSLPAKFMHNKVINYGLAFLDNWGEHYHGLFLFLSGDDIQRNKVPETGQMYLYDLILIVIGLFAVIKSNSLNRKSVLLLVFWLFIAPFAAALTFQSPHALRSENMVIPLVVLSAIGMATLIDICKQKKLSYLVFIFGLLIVWSFLRYQHMYWVHMAKEYKFSSQYGLKELVNYVENNFTEKTVVVTDRYDQPYILFLFYTKYDPSTFQANHTLTTRDGYGFSTVNKFDRYRFFSIKFDEMKLEYPNSLIIGTPEEIHDEANIIKEIYGSNGHHYFDIVAN